MRNTMMKKACSILLCLPLFFGLPGFLFGDDGAAGGENAASRSAGENIKYGFITTAEIMLSIGIVMGYNIFIPPRPSWAIPTADSIYGNFTSPWQWEEVDGFKDNQIGHPYHGSTYFSAARANGFSFYESALFSVFGSFSWESFAESNHASINDFIISTTGSLSIGEMLYRIYVEACAAGVPAPLAFLINPVAGFNRLVTGWEPPNYGRNMYELQVYLGAGYSVLDSSMPGYGGNRFSFDGFLPVLGASAVYGNPFEQETRIPFAHFEFAASLGTNASTYLTSRLISDGYLFSFSPLYTDNSRMSTGLSLHMDYMSAGVFDNSSTFDHFSNALDWTVKYQRMFSARASFEAKLHAGITFLGVSEFYLPEGVSENYRPGESGPANNFGSGVNSKLFFNLKHEKLGELKADLFCYFLWSIPGTSKIKNGHVFWLFNDLTYSYPVSKHFSVGVTNFFALELASFGNFPNTRKYSNEVRLFIAWNL